MKVIKKPVTKYELTFDVSAIKKGQVYQLQDTLDSHNGMYIVLTVKETEIKLAKMDRLDVVVSLMPEQDRFIVKPVKLTVVEDKVDKVDVNTNKAKKEYEKQLDDFADMLQELISKEKPIIRYI